MKSKHLFLIILILGITTSEVFAADEAKPFIYDDHGRRDPILPLVSSTGLMINYSNEMQTSEIILEGIMAAGAGDNIAIINGNIVQEGDMFGKFNVFKIEKRAVILKRGTEEVILRLKIDQ